MNKKIPVGVVLALISVVIAVTVAVTVSVYFHTFNDLIKDLPQRAQQYAKITDIDELIRSEYYGEINYDRLNASIADGYIDGLGDPYSFYISPDNFETYKNILDGRMTGIGIQTYYDAELNCLTITFVEQNSPAFAAGLKKDFHILSVNGKKVTQKNHKKLSEEIADSLSKSIKIAYIENIGDKAAAPTEADINTGYSETSCSCSVEGNIGYIRMSAVYNDTPEQFSAAVEELKTNSVTGIILDLRNCCSHNLDAASKIIDMIVPLGSEGSKAVYTAKNESGEILKVYSSDASSISLRFAVLVNNRTECAAELIACDLRDFGKAVIIGEITAGHGKMQQIFELKDGGAVFLSVAEIYPYISDSFDGKGVEPDIEVFTSDTFKNQIGTADFSEDEQYQKAFAYLSGQN